MPASKRRNRSTGQGVVQTRADSVRVATLTRISTDEVNQPYSLEAQAIGLDSFVASQPGHTITHRFVDQASGATLDRPGLQGGARRCEIRRLRRPPRLPHRSAHSIHRRSHVDRRGAGAAGVALRSATELG